MGKYICQKCGRIVENIEKTVCPYCSGRILIKKPSSRVRELSAR